MILDAEDLTKVLTKVVSTGLKKALFENHFAVQKKSIRYFEPGQDFLALMQKDVADGGLTKDEGEFYEPEIDAQLRANEMAERGKNFHKMEYLSADPLLSQLAQEMAEDIAASKGK